MKKCESCRYLGGWKENDDGWDENTVRECRRYPPHFTDECDYGFYKLVFIEEYCCGEWRAKIKERKNSSHNTKRDVICPKCDYEYPRLYEDGHYKCDECGFVWVGQPSPIL